jgi:hypothetical protein
MKTALVDIPSEERAYKAGMSRILLYKSHLTETAYTAWLALAVVPVVLFYVLFLVCHYRARGVGLLRCYIKGVSAGLLAKGKLRRRAVIS